MNLSRQQQAERVRARRLEDGQRALQHAQGDLGYCGFCRRGVSGYAVVHVPGDSVIHFSIDTVVHITGCLRRGRRTGAKVGHLSGVSADGEDQHKH